MDATAAAPVDAVAGAAPLIAARAVSRRFPSGLVALADATLAVARGEFVSVIGPSGCGKSTLLRLLAGLDEPSAGRIERADVAAADVGFVFQDPTLLPWADAAANVALPLKLKRWPRERIDAAVTTALAAMGLDGFAGALPRELSGGMRMRVAIARALVTRPALLLLDEPFAALDEMTRFRLNQDLLARWHEARFTAVFVTHGIYEAVFLSQRVVVMSARPGRIVGEVTIDLPRPRDDATRASAHYAALCGEVLRLLRAAGAAADGATDDGAVRDRR
jgi:NitT/TauT family transport system ATP-binding protein